MKQGEIMPTVEGNQETMDEKLSAEIMEKLGEVDFRQYLYAQCRSAVGRELGVEEEDLLNNEKLVLPAHWQIDGKTIESIGEEAGNGANDSDPYYKIDPFEIINEEVQTFEIKHESNSGNTRIEFVIKPDVENKSLRIMDIKVYKASEGTAVAIDEAAFIGKEVGIDDIGEVEKMRNKFNKEKWG